MAKLNCWEFKKCGRQKNGAEVNELGVCLAATEVRLNGINNGKNGGRACWAIAGTLCGGKVQGRYAFKMGNCMQCDVYKTVQQEEGRDFKTGSDILDKLK
ncbi:MAG: two-CW domain-containing protein [Candidatus Omnitrophota bacterium]